MIQLLFTVIVVEMTVILILLFKTPLRKFVVIALDRVKREGGPLVVKTVAGVVFAVLLVDVYNLREIQNRSVDAINPTDQVLSAKYMLEASLMGFLLFLLLIIDRLHHYIRELRLLRKTMEAAKKQTRGFDDAKNGSSEELKALGAEVSTLKSKVMKLESECDAKDKEVKAAEANVVALKSQSEGLLLKYDQVVEENQNLRNQLQSIDQSVSHSDIKKST